jgi:uncharacterized membrane protein YfcA
VVWHAVLGFVAGMVISVVTAPVGISGAVFLLPVQLSVLRVPSPAVTPTNLLYNVVAVPGALARYRRHGFGDAGLVRRLLAGTIPGVIAGAVIRVFVLPGGVVFRLVIAVVLLPLGIWLLARPEPRVDLTAEIAPQQLIGGQTVTGLALIAGLVGGIYGIGGGSLLAPVLVGAGYLVTEVAPAALVSTFVTSCVGALTYAVLDLTGRQQAGPHWTVGLSCGLGGLAGGYLGAALQPRLPRHLLRRLLGAVAAGLALAYLIAALRR